MQRNKRKAQLSSCDQQVAYSGLGGVRRKTSDLYLFDITWWSKTLTTIMYNFVAHTNTI